MNPHFPIRLLVNTPQGHLPLTAERASLELPRGPDSTGASLSYGPYLTALSNFLTQDSCRLLRAALSRHLRRTVDLEPVQALEIISQKHGAVYHVAQVRVCLPQERISLALNVAVTADQKAFLQREFGLLEEFHQRHGFPFLPRPYGEGEAVYVDPRSGRQTLNLFLAEWFEGYHEFHLSKRAGEDMPVIRVWDLEEGEELLAGDEARSLYAHAAAILTACFDAGTFRQIYPWHHAAGDFIVRRRGGEVDLRLITARDYRALLAPGSGPGQEWIAMVHFFLNTSLRMRLDRLDGTGDLAWASSDCLRGTVSGFLRAWAEKVRGTPSLPLASEVLELLRSFSPQEWLGLAEIVLEDGMVEADELAFLQSRLDEHMASLAGVLQEEVEGMG